VNISQLKLRSEKFDNNNNHNNNNNKKNNNQSNENSDTAREGMKYIKVKTGESLSKNGKAK
jgi:hypothetical protein